MLLIKNARLVNRKIVNIVSIDGKIHKIDSNFEVGGRFIDLEGLTVLPGIIDPHVHNREPKFYNGNGTWETESRAAAAGGVTTVLDMPNTSPAVANEGVLRQKRQIVTDKSCVNFGFYVAAGEEDNTEFLEEIEGVAGVKVYMGKTTGGILVSDDDLLRKYFALDKLVAVHTDNVERALRLCKRELVFSKDGFQSCFDLNRMHPLYFCHISTKNDFELLKETEHYIEVTPHHLFLDESCEHPYATMNPCLGSSEDVEYLWDNLDRVDVVASDHAPHSRDRKREGAKGIPGVQTMLPLMLNAVSEGRLSLERLVELMSSNPARIFGLKDKGKIEVGYDADLTVVDMEITKNVIDRDMLYGCGWTPYRGKLKGWPVMTIVGGKVVYDELGINPFSENVGREVEYVQSRKI